MKKANSHSVSNVNILKVTSGPNTNASFVVFNYIRSFFGCSEVHDDDKVKSDDEEEEIVQLIASTEKKLNMWMVLKCLQLLNHTWVKIS